MPSVRVDIATDASGFSIFEHAGSQSMERTTIAASSKKL
jgi:hypothetical protein